MNEQVPNKLGYNLEPPKLVGIPTRQPPQFGNIAQYYFCSPLFPLNSKMRTGPLESMLLPPDMREIDISRY